MQITSNNTNNLIHRQNTTFPFFPHQSVTTGTNQNREPLTLSKLSVCDLTDHTLNLFGFFTELQPVCDVFNQITSFEDLLLFVSKNRACAYGAYSDIRTLRSSYAAELRLVVIVLL
ncbi:hypothetical protein N665_0210s0020 [Sinapis alba]|nr:hypothetical protein N665_0210s0020 [Sinapis alba]